ncbi:hypothetical protein GCM10025864_39060 [Luteimicrobium album]|uniref:AI-2E family transporter n=1 Tax=Luteimicrobium album TaxID=1054550 RepID=A0ABQ6I7E7_9MICO|nr:hypothetical protein GCM10025864_39060 [Luteimicrobium album]
MSPAARKVAGARRNPSAVGVTPDPVPLWLRTVAGWIWRLLFIIVAVALVFWATSQVRLLFIALFVAFVFTSVLRPVVKLFDRVMWRWLAVLLSLLLAIAVFGGS